MAPYSRRQFIGAAGAAGAATLTTARSYAQVSGSNERLRVGVIGCGGMGTNHMNALIKTREIDNVEITAVSDVYDKRLDKAAKLTGGKPYKDYRRILDNKDIDWVLIASPEHWHYNMTMDAADAGKAIYCEKPMTHTVQQSKKVVAKIEKTGVKMQVGVQGMSDDSYETAHKYVKEGAIGKVVLAQIDYSRNYKDNYWAYPIDPDAKPGVNLDWKAWQGPAPKHPWDPNRYFRWRWFWDYSGGISSDLFIHRVTRIIKALDLKFPSRGVATGGKFYFTKSAAEVPDTFNILLDYPEQLTVQLISSLANDTKVDHMLRGHKATLFFTRTGFEIKAQRLFQGQVKEVVYQKHGAESIILHHRNLMNAIRHGTPLKCDSHLGYYGVVATVLGTESYRKQRYLAWDSRRQRLVKA